MDERMIVQYPNLTIEVPDYPWARNHQRNTVMAAEVYEGVESTHVEMPCMLAILRETGDLIELGWFPRTQLVMVTSTNAQTSAEFSVFMDEDEFISDMLPFIELLGHI